MHKMQVQPTQITASVQVLNLYEVICTDGMISSLSIKNDCLISITKMEIRKKMRSNRRFREIISLHIISAVRGSNRPNLRSSFRKDAAAGKAGDFAPYSIQTIYARFPQ